MIQIDEGIAGARIGNTKAQVRTALGKPKKVEGPTANVPSTIFRYSGKLSVAFVAGEGVTRVSTSGKGDRTAGDVGVGSTERALKRKVSGLGCETVVSEERVCLTGEPQSGKIVTTFSIKRGKVFRVDISNEFRPSSRP